MNWLGIGGDLLDVVYYCYLVFIDIKNGVLLDGTCKHVLLDNDGCIWGRVGKKQKSFDILSFCFD
jgi:hypothetical protein